MNKTATDAPMSDPIRKAKLAEAKNNLDYVKRRIEVTIESGFDDPELDNLKTKWEGVVSELSDG